MCFAIVTCLIKLTAMGWATTIVGVATTGGGAGMVVVTVGGRRYREVEVFRFLMGSVGCILREKDGVLSNKRIT